MIKEICIEPGCPFKGGYCRVPGHKKQRTGDAPPKPVAPRKAIPKESPQRKQDKKQYEKNKRELKKEQPTCQLAIAGVCIKEPVHPHHIEGRTGENYQRKENLIMACDPCNQYLVDHPQFGMETGMTKTRLKHSIKRGHLYQQA